LERTEKGIQTDSQRKISLGKPLNSRLLERKITSALIILWMAKTLKILADRFQEIFFLPMLQEVYRKFNWLVQHFFQ
jgi:hypothetical protein